MKPMDFIRKLLPSFGKKDVRDKLRMSLSKLSDVVSAALEDVAQAIPESAFTSRYGKALMAAFAKFATPRIRQQRQPLFDTIERAKTNALKLGELLTDHTAKVFKDSIHVEGITYQTVTVLRLIEIIDFFTDYTSRMLLRLVTAETNGSVFQSAEEGELSKAELDYLEGRRDIYFRIVELLYDDPKMIMSKLVSMPDVLVSPDSNGAVPALMGGAGDPLELGVIPLLSNLFTAAGIRSTNADIERYERAKKERRAIAMRLELLRQRGNGQSDARGQAIIEGYERELVLIRSKIAQMEERQ